MLKIWEPISEFEYGNKKLVKSSIIEFCIKHKALFFLNYFRQNYPNHNLARLLTYPWKKEMEGREYYFDLADVPFSEEWLDKFLIEYEGKIHWYYLSKIDGVQWTNQLLQKHKDKIPFPILSEHIKNVNLVRESPDLWNWELLSFNHNLKWAENDLIEFKNSFNWIGISSNPNITISLNIIEQLQDYIFWGKNDYTSWDCLPAERIPFGIQHTLIHEFGFSYNPSLPWSIELLERFEKKWDWKIISQNHNIKWDAAMIKRFSTKIYWGKDATSVVDEEIKIPYPVDRKDGLSSCHGVMWTPKLIEKYEDKIAWGQLSGNSGVNWTPELILKYKQKIKLKIEKYPPLNIEVKLERRNEFLWGNPNIKINSTLLKELENEDVHPNSKLPRTCFSDVDWWWLCFNQHLTFEIIEEFENYFDMTESIYDYSSMWNEDGDSLSSNCWDVICINPFLKWDEKMLEKYSAKINPYLLASNNQINWHTNNLNIILKNRSVKEREGIFYWLSRNIGNFWNFSFIKYYENEWDWGALCDNTAVWDKAFSQFFSADVTKFFIENLKPCKEASDFFRDKLSTGLSSGQWETAFILQKAKDLPFK